jgi:hypothetical protein
MIGSNRDLHLIRSALDSEIEALSHLARHAPDLDHLSRHLSILIRERKALSAALANRHVEAANKVVDLSRWFSGDGALREVLHHIAAIPTAGHLRRV